MALMMISYGGCGAVKPCYAGDHDDDNGVAVIVMFPCEQWPCLRQRNWHSSLISGWSMMPGGHEGDVWGMMVVKVGHDGA